MFADTHTFSFLSAKSLLPIALFGAVAISGAMTSGCSGSKADPEAQALFDQASQAFEARDYAQATVMLDSLQKTFPAEIALQREAMALRPKVIEHQTLLDISRNDSLQVVAQLNGERLKPLLVWVKTPRMVEGYWIGKSSNNPNFLNTTGVQGRVSELGEFYLVSSMNPAGNHTAVSLSDGSTTVSTPEVPYDGESNYRLNGSEVITFSPAQSDTIGQFAFNHADRPLTLTFRGKRSKSVKLSAAQVTALADAWAYSQAVVGARNLTGERARLEATLQVARNQIARTAQVEEEK